MNQPAQNPAVAFGDFVRETRMKNGLTGRDSARKADMLPSNFSKLEHGVLLPPRDAERQRQLACAIGIVPDAPEARQFFDLAGAATNAVPLDLADIISKSETIPLLLRTIGNKRLTEKEIEALVELVHQK
jgi:transcriptional regulator with XRE-family HTH domain